MNKIAVDKDAIRAVIQALQAPRTRFGKLDPDHTHYAKLRPHFVKANPPNGGLDIVDQCAMTLQGLIRDPVTSVTKLGAVLAVALGLWCTTPAPAAADVAVSTTCFGRSCVTTFGRTGDPNVRHVPGPVTAEEAAEAEARDAAWWERCQPRETHDRYGVTRFVYARPGCEYGAGY